MSNVTNQLQEKKASQERLMSVLLGPHVSEKGSRITESSNQFVFRVRPDATRPEIKAAVELMFEVKVAGVNVVNVAGKQKRFGQRLGRRQDFKKAYVRLAAGQNLDLTGSEA
jgi:large subunit ribosomal protein L23